MWGNSSCLSCWIFCIIASSKPRVLVVNSLPRWRPQHSTKRATLHTGHTDVRTTLTMYCIGLFQVWSCWKYFIQPAFHVGLTSLLYVQPSITSLYTSINWRGFTNVFKHRCWSISVRQRRRQSSADMNCRLDAASRSVVTGDIVTLLSSALLSLSMPTTAVSAATFESICSPALWAKCS